MPYGMSCRQCGRCLGAKSGYCASCGTPIVSGVGDACIEGKEEAAMVNGVWYCKACASHVKGAGK